MYINVLTQIRNAQMVGKKNVKIPFSKMDESVLTILSKAGFVESAEKKGRGIKKYFDVTLRYQDNGEGAIEGVRLISKPSRRIYKKSTQLYPVRQGRGIAVISTPGGVMADADARKQHMGGEVLFEIW